MDLSNNGNLNSIVDRLYDYFQNSVFKNEGLDQLVDPSLETHSQAGSPDNDLANNDCAQLMDQAQQVLNETFPEGILIDSDFEEKIRSDLASDHDLNELIKQLSELMEDK